MYGTVQAFKYLDLGAFDSYIHLNHCQNGGNEFQAESTPRRRQHHGIELTLPASTNERPFHVDFHIEDKEHFPDQSDRYHEGPACKLGTITGSRSMGDSWLTAASHTVRWIGDWLKCPMAPLSFWILSQRLFCLSLSLTSPERSNGFTKLTSRLLVFLYPGPAISVILSLSRSRDTPWHFRGCRIQSAQMQM